MHQYFDTKTAVYSMGSPDSRNQCFLLTINFLLNQKYFTFPIRDVPESEYHVQKGNDMYY